MILNQESELSRRHSELLTEYVFYYVSIGRSSEIDYSTFRRKLFKDLSEHKEDYSRSDVFQDIFVIEGSMLKIGESRMGLGNSLQHFYLKKRAPIIRISQFLHQHNKALASLVEITVSDLEKGRYSREDRLRIQETFLWLLRNVHDKHMKLITDFISRVARISEALADRLNSQVAMKKTVVSSPGTGVKKEGDLMDAFELTFDGF